MSKKNNPTKQKQSFWNMHLTSTISISLVLFLIGLTCMLVLVARDMSVHVRENINLSVILDDEIDSEYVKRIERYLNASPYAKSAEYISKDAALEELINTLGEDPQEFLGYNPLLASIEVKLNAEYANSDSVAVIEGKLKSFDHINRISYQKDMVNLVNNNVRKMSIVLLGLTFILLLISVALINNTVRLSIYSNRFLINTMKLVGATSWFIRKPYIRRSIWNGFIAAVLSIIYLAVVIYYLKNRFGFDGMTIMPETMAFVAVIIVAAGILITGASSYFAVGRYLRMSTNDMYLV
ncbi:permease-like cell division protein FtsX [Paludibacteraceae bacterium OttesenSCG-928-F17]|nr:permease-like cell division protein FtsX [Paludibacteraceae bacterium OttesenSCG-928-F17]